MRHFGISLAGLALAVAATGPAVAQQLVTANDQYVLLRIAQEFGGAELDTDSTGAPVIYADFGDLVYGIFFYGCDTNCATVQLLATFDPPDGDPMALANRWNNERLYGAAASSDDGSMSIQYTINLDFGVSEQNFRDSLDIWRIALSDFADFIYDGVDPAPRPAPAPQPAPQPAPTK